MINPEEFYKSCIENEITFFTGVPDSLLKNFCSYVSDNSSAENHIINSNEGASVALASGYYLSTGKPAFVYMQNSGLGNSVNPLLSLADTEVYGIPMLIMIGWRGEPGIKDEPQHIKQGRVMLKMLEAMELPYRIINKDTANFKETIFEAVEYSRNNLQPFVFVISEGTFSKYELKNSEQNNLSLSREQALEIILDEISEEDVLVTTTGKTSREIFEYRERKNQIHRNDFLTVGSMGHCSQIALGIALQKKDKKVIAIDGDGAVIMHMGSLSIIGSLAPENYKHILINNGAHESVGGQPTAGFKIDFNLLSKSCGYKYFASAQTEEQLKTEIGKFMNEKGPAMLEVRVNKTSRSNLGRPTKSPKENKKNFMDFLSE